MPSWSPTSFALRTSRRPSPLNSASSRSACVRFVSVVHALLPAGTGGSILPGDLWDPNVLVPSGVQDAARGAAGGKGPPGVRACLRPPSLCPGS
jgi:hypothetical protein